MYFSLILYFYSIYLSYFLSLIFINFSLISLGNIHAVSLKIKEISYIHSESYHAGELKHGTISLITDKTPVISIITDETIADKTISNLKEVKSRGANVIYLTTENLNKDGDFYDKKIIIPDTNSLLQPLLTILPLQLVA